MAIEYVYTAANQQINVTNGDMLGIWVPRKSSVKWGVSGEGFLEGGEVGSEAPYRAVEEPSDLPKCSMFLAK